MIRRETADGWLLISQVDHARLAYDLAAAWGNEQVLGLPLRDELLSAIRDHDEGWRSWEAAPAVNEYGEPRAFTELDSATATAIWQQSIATAAGGVPSLSAAMQSWRKGGDPISPAAGLVLEAVITHRGSVGYERLTRRLTEQESLTQDEVAGALAHLEQQGVLRRLPNAIGGPAAEIALPVTGASPLGGLWVAGHFAALAEMAKEHRQDNPADLQAAKEFLADVADRTAGWRAAIHDFAGEERERVIHTGIRYVQFFDRVSLWLCMEERDEPWEATLASDRTFTFEPLSPTRIAVSPWPFASREVRLRVTGVELPAVPFSAAEELQIQLRTAPQAALEWTLCRKD